jgi:radical SAM protein with 4Fe4S-binding SPASM domain
VYPCVQFPLPSGNVRQQAFIDIWNYSPQLNEVRTITARELPVCSSCSHVGACTRCPGLAYMEGSMRGPSLLDCEKSFARTGIPTANMLVKGKSRPDPLVLVQIQGVRVQHTAAAGHGPKTPQLELISHAGADVR